MNLIVYVSLLLLVNNFVDAEPEKNEKLAKIRSNVLELRQRVKALLERLEDAQNTQTVLSGRLNSALEKLKEVKIKRPERKTFLSRQVAFYVALRHSVHALNVNDPIIFDEIFTSTSTDVYNDVNGIFTAPASGIYCFSWTNNVDATDFQSTELVIEGKPVGWAYADTKGDQNEDDYGSASQTIVLEVKQGEHVWIRTGPQGKGTLHGEDYSTFSGFLLYPIDNEQ